MFNDEEYEFDDLTPDEESFPVDDEQEEMSPSDVPLGQLKQKSGIGSKKDADNLRGIIDKNKAKNASGNVAKQASAAKKDNNQAENENGSESGDENQQDGDNKTNKKEDLEKAAASEAAKIAASTAMKSAGVPAPIADKASEKIVDSEQGQKIIDETIKKFKAQKKKILL